MRRTVPLLAVTMVLVGCSGEEAQEKETGPKALEWCKFAEQLACGVETDGSSDALLLCEVTEEYGRVWTVKESCACGCADAACVACPVPDVLGELSTLDAFVDVTEAELPPLCEPQCEGKSCGDDGCDGQCGQCGGENVCGEDFKCHLHCAPKCKEKQCGDDGCGGSCGGCPFNMACMDGFCACKPQCEGKGCGPDGCGGQCGECAQGYQCSPFGQCEELCKPDCSGKECGSDGCGGMCGACAPWLFCNALGKCTTDCVPDCTGKVCGSDGCTGVCGFCPCAACPLDATQCSPAGLCLVPDTGLGCNDLLNCLAECNADPTCQNDCFLDSTPQAQQYYEALVNCIIAQCGPAPTDQCVQDSVMGFCLQHYLNCIDDM